MLPAVRSVLGVAAAIVAAACFVPHALAQGSSAGGSIGKQNKSTSGEAPAAPVAPPPVSRARAAPPEARRPVDNCARIAGTWTANGFWNAIYGRGDVQFQADGSAQHKSGIVGTWTCSGNHFVVRWKNWTTDVGTLSADGNTIEHVDGGQFTRGY